MAKKSKVTLNTTCLKCGRKSMLVMCGRCKKKYEDNKKSKCNLCQDSGWVCEIHEDKPFEHDVWHSLLPPRKTSCVGAGMPCQCNTYNPPWNYPDATRSEVTQ